MIALLKKIIAVYFSVFKCLVKGHDYRVVRNMNIHASKVHCGRCGKAWAMHDPTRTFVPWDEEIEAMYAPGGPLDPEVHKP